MTVQAREILILDGKKTSMELCPPLPKGDARIVRSPSKMICSACWRGYVGTWEIKQGKMYLVGLAGSYALCEGAFIFAEWFSGEIILHEGNALEYNSMGTPCRYEREQIIKIKLGVVVERVCVDNRPHLPDSSEIKRFVEGRGVSSLFHFTRVANIPSILEFGLLGRESVECNGIKAQFNDQYRYDHAEGAVCASISFPNYKLFYSLRQQNPGEDWAVIRLDPKVLWEIPCAFCFSNAASSEVFSIPIQDRMGFNALQLMFGDVHPNVKRADLRLADEYATDPQAEVLILGPVGPDYIINISINEEVKINNMAEIKRLLQPFSENFQFLHDGSLFSYRKDYEYWRRAVQEAW